MSPIDYALTPLRKYADFSGRARRSEYWWYFLLVVILSIVAMILDSILGLGGMFGTYGLFGLIVGLGALVPSLAAAVRRLHDTNRSGWWLLLAVVPYVIFAITTAMALAGGDPATAGMGALATAGLMSIVALIGGLVVLVFLVLDGTHGDNRFGPDPKEAERTPAAV